MALLPARLIPPRAESGRLAAAPGWPGSRRRIFLRALGLGLAAYLLARPILALAHELLILLAANLLEVIAGLGSDVVLHGRIPLDPIYTGTLFTLLAHVDVSGVAVAEPVGGLLHTLLPSVFTTPTLVADSAWASAVLQPGSSVLARGLVRLSADVALLALGLRLARPGTDGAFRPSWLAIVGTLLQAHIVLNHLADEPISLPDLEATGLTYGFSVLFTGPAAERPRLTAFLASLPEPVRNAVLAAVAVSLAYALALSLLATPRLARRLLRARGRWWSSQHAARRWPLRLSRPGWRPVGRPALTRGGVAIFALTVVASPLGSFVVGNSYQLAAPSDTGPDLLVTPTALPPSGLAAVVPEPTNAPTQAPAATASPAPTTTPRGHSTVIVAGSDYAYTYRVDGVRQVIRGMGYNPTYTQLSTEERTARYDRDFATMREVGVNTILGWVTNEWDELLLDKAEQYGLGVILPYDLDPNLDYTAPDVRETITRDVLAWVSRYRDHPALRMWGLGNEVLHKLVYPSWMHLRGDPLTEARADAFAVFYVDLLDRIHELDPNHPVTYRAAEEAYLPRMREALNATGIRRPWFVYGINIYTPRLADVIANWSNLGLDAPLLISEFGPGRAGPADRPRGYGEMWAMVRAQPERVLGGAPYVWTTRGPEEVDRIFGLVDATGQPVDGSLAAIGRLFRGEVAAEPTLSAGPGASGPCDGSVLNLFVTTVQGIRTNLSQMAYQASTPPSIMGPLDNLAPDPLRPADIRFERVDDPARLAWQRQVGYTAEWWISWNPPSRPGDQVAMLIRAKGGQLEVAYVYHGPGSPPPTSWTCA